MGAPLRGRADIRLSGVPAEPDGALGEVEIAAGANLPRRPLAPETLAVLRRVAALSGGALVVSSRWAPTTRGSPSTGSSPTTQTGTPLTSP
jgi:hypothetical protein